MKEIKVETKWDVYEQVPTKKCPWFSETGTMVGSIGCFKCYFCDHFGGENSKTVYCRHY